MYAAEKKIQVDITDLFLKSIFHGTQKVNDPSKLSDIFFNYFHVDLGAEKSEFCKEGFTKNTYGRMFLPKDPSTNFIYEQ